MRNLILLFIFLCSGVKINAQSIYNQWAKGVGGSSEEFGSSIHIDASGNLCMVGYFLGTTDFDPSSATANLISSGSYDIFIAKYDSSGNYIWAKNIGGTGNENAYSITTDSSSNIYVTGYFSGTVDFDPGTGAANLTAIGLSDIFIAKYDSSGNYILAKRIGSSYSDIGYAILIDNSENLYITGSFQATADFDPSSGTANLTAIGITDIFIAKYDISGNYIWAKSIGGNSSDYSYAIQLDNSKNLYVTGYFQDVADFDPGTATANLTAIGAEDIFIAKYDSMGNYIWAKDIGGTSDEEGSSMAIDSMNNIYITGKFKGTTDFNPGTGTITLVSAGDWDGFFAKYDSSGNYVWVRKFGGQNSDISTSIQVDIAGEVYITGYFQDTVDFNPSVGTANLVSNGGEDVFIAKYDTLGLLIWAKNIGGSNTDIGYSFDLDLSNNIFILGGFHDTVDFDLSAGLNTLTLVGLSDIFIAKYAPCITMVQNIFASICSGDSYILPSGTIVTTADTYSDTFLTITGCDSIIITTLTVNTVYKDYNIVSICDGDSYALPSGSVVTTAGTYIDTLSSIMGCDSIITISLSINSTYQTIDSVFICSGDSYTLPGGSVVTTSGVYNDTLLSISGCDSLVITVLEVNSTSNQSSTFSYEWAKSIGGSSLNAGYGYSIKSDNSENIYVTGYFQGTVDFDPSIGTANLTASSTDAFVAKYDSSGNYVWAKNLVNMKGTSIWIDNAGNAYVTGSGGKIWKFDISGNLLWSEGIGTSLKDIGLSICVDANGNIYYTGYFIDSNNDYGIFMAKYDASGNLLWSNYIDNNNSSEQSTSIEVDSSGNIIIAGSFTSTTDFDPGAGVTNLATNGTGDIFIAKYDSNGTLLWAKSIGSTGDDGANALQVSISGDIYVTGYFLDTVDFDPGYKIANLYSTLISVFIAKYSPSGIFEWAKSTNANKSVRSMSIQIDNSENVYITGDGSGTIDFDPGVDTVNFTNKYNAIFIAKYDACGNYIWAGMMGNSNFNHGYSIDLDSTDNVYITGCFKDTADFDPGVDISNLTSSPSSSSYPNIFIAKYSQQNFITKTTATKESHKDIKIYPNPVSTTLFIESAEPFAIKIFNALGELVHEATESVNHSSINSIDVSKLPEGIYFVTLQINNTILNKNIILIR